MERIGLIAACLALLCLPGCRARLNQELLERELRIQEERILYLEEELEQYRGGNCPPEASGRFGRSYGSTLGSQLFGQDGIIEDYSPPPSSRWDNWSEPRHRGDSRTLDQGDGRTSPPSRSTYEPSSPANPRGADAPRSSTGPSGTDLSPPRVEVPNSDGGAPWRSTPSAPGTGSPMSGPQGSGQPSGPSRLQRPAFEQAPPYSGPPQISPPSAEQPEGQKVETINRPPTDDADWQLPPINSRQAPPGTTGGAYSPGTPARFATSSAGADDALQGDAVQGFVAGRNQVVALTLNRQLTTGYNADDRLGDEGISVLLEPRDAEGRLLDVAGEVSVVLMDPLLEGPTARVARWNLPADQVARRVRPGAGILLRLPWQGSLPQHESLDVFVRLTTPEGLRIDADQAIEVNLGTAQRVVIEQNTPGGAIPPGTVSPSGNAMPSAGPAPRPTLANPGQNGRMPR